MPASAARRDGKEVRNCQSILANPFMARLSSRIARIPSVVIVRTMPRRPNHWSMPRRRRARRSRSWAFFSGSTVELLSQTVAGQVEPERQQEQHGARDKDRLVSNAAVG